MSQVLRAVHAEYGMCGLFQGLLPRMGLNVWLTLFMVSGIHVTRQLRESSERVESVVSGGSMVRQLRETSERESVRLA